MGAAANLASADLTSAAAHQFDQYQHYRLPRSATVDWLYFGQDGFSREEKNATAGENCCQPYQAGSTTPP
jgi:hypothetical protein